MAGISDGSDGENPDSDEERQKKKQKTAIAAFDDTSDLDDEVERILSHRYATSAVFSVTPLKVESPGFVHFPAVKLRKRTHV